MGLSNVLRAQAVLGVTPLLCGVLMLPYALGGALASVPTAWFNDYASRKTGSTSCYKQVIVVGLALSTLGFGACSCGNHWVIPDASSLRLAHAP